MECFFEKISLTIAYQRRASMTLDMRQRGEEDMGGGREEGWDAGRTITVTPFAVLKSLHFINMGWKKTCINNLNTHTYTHTRTKKLL